MSKARVAPPPLPCGTCPYRKDVPSGIWDRSEYEKLLRYDKPLVEQPTNLFLCHQRDGCLCGGWLLTHGVTNLLALRLRPVDPAVGAYAPGTPVFDSGQAAHDHGVRDISNPGSDARRKMRGLLKLPGIREPIE